MKLQNTSRRLGALALVLLSGTALAQAVEVHEAVLVQVSNDPQEADAAPDGSSLKARVVLQQKGAGLPRGTHLELVVKAVVDTQGWSARLTTDDIDARELAFDELVVVAAKHPGLYQALQIWSADSKQPELAWTSRMALRDLSRRSQQVRMAWVPRMVQTPRGSAIFIPMEAVAPRVVGEEGQNGLRQLPLKVASPLDGSHQVSLVVPRTVEFSSEGQGLPVPVRHVNVRFHPEGVVLVIQDYQMGRVKVRTYAAQSLGPLVKAHPELLTQVPGLSGLLAMSMESRKDFRWESDDRTVRLHAGSVERPTLEPHTRGHAPARARTIILGVKCVPLSDKEAERRMLGPGVGLLIERREPGSVAEALELQRGDILVEILGQQLCTAEEITRILKENRQESITVKIVDRHGIERTRTWTPGDDAPK